MDISSALSTDDTLSDADIMIEDPSEWLVLLVSGENRIYNYFEDYMLPFYEFLFTRI